jgi:hypothetical protein
VFDSKLKWSNHTAYAINCANQALNATKSKRKFFSTKELIILVTSNFYSILFHNSEVWHLPSLNHDLKNSLFVVSAAALNVCLHFPVKFISYHDLHKITNRAMPIMLCKYKLALLLYRTLNEKIPETEWLYFTENIGFNCASQKYHLLHDTILLTLFNKNHDSFSLILIVCQMTLTYNLSSKMTVIFISLM